MSKSFPAYSTHEALHSTALSFMPSAWLCYTRNERSKRPFFLCSCLSQVKPWCCSHETHFWMRSLCIGEKQHYEFGQAISDAKWESVPLTLVFRRACYISLIKNKHTSGSERCHDPKAPLCQERYQPQVSKTMPGSWSVLTDPASRVCLPSPLMVVSHKVAVSLPTK